MLKCSIAMTTYNGEKYLQEQLDSLKHQSLLPYELIVVDDCSNDRTIDILNKFKESAPFSVKIIQNNNNIASNIENGFAINFEKAISYCNGDIIFFSDQDDVWFADKLAKHVEIYLNSPNILMVSNNAIRTYSDLSHENITQLDFQKIAWAGSNLAIGCCLSLRSKFLKKFILPIPRLYPHDIWSCKCIDVFGARYDIKEPLQYFRRQPRAWSTINGGQSCVSRNQCYWFKIKRIFNYLIKHSNHTSWLNKMIYGNKEISKRLNSYAKELGFEKKLVEFNNKLLQNYDLLKHRKEIVESISLKSKIKKIKILLKNNPKYTFSNSLKDLLCE